MERMTLILTYLLGISFLFIDTSSGQFDQNLCPDGLSAPITDPKWSIIPLRFELVTELVSGNEAIELTQAFSTTRDAITTSSPYGQVQFYWNYLTNEQFEVLTAIVNQQAVPGCFRQVITSDSKTSVIDSNSLILKPSVLLGFDSRNQRNTQWGLRYDGNEDVHGIPTNRFKSCFYVNDIGATVAATYYTSDTTKFQAYLTTNQSIIVKIKVNITNSLGRRDSYSYNVFRYSPNPGRHEERQALETPTGVFCPNRTSTLPVPSNIPERVSANTELYLPNFNNSIYSSHGLYDTQYQFTRFDVWLPDPAGGPTWLHLTEIHDFAVGLSYQYNNLNDQCSVHDIVPGLNDAIPVDDKPNLLQMGDPTHLFLLDDVGFHYTGEKRCRDRVWCHIWIAEKQLPNNTVQQREWYWASRVNGEPLTEWIPMKLVLKQYVSGAPVGTYEMNIFDFRRRPMTIFEIDFTLANCYRALGPTQNYNLAVLSFKIANDKNYPVMQNLNFLRLHIWETLVFAMFVRPIRISNIIVDKDGNDILVTFTLLDAPPRTGPVETPLQESSLDSLIDRLSSLIDSNRLSFRARYNSKQINLFARNNSLNVAHRTAEDIKLSSGPKITGLWIGFIVVGLLVGTIGGFFVFRHFAKS